MAKFKTLYDKPKPICFKPDTDTKFVDQSEADRCSLKYQLERFGMDSLLHQFEQTKSQFGYADTRMSGNFLEMHNKVAEANSYFMALPSRIRAKFDHSALKFFTELEQNPTKAFKEGYISKDLAIKLNVKEAMPVSDIVETLPKVDDVKVDTITTKGPELKGEVSA